MSAWQGSSVGGGRVSPEASARWRAECERAGGDCAARVEAVALRMPWARAVRRGKTLELFTQGQARHYLDHGEQAFRYLGPVLEEDRHVLWQRAGAGQSFLLVGAGLDPEPVFSSLDLLLEHLAKAGMTAAA